METLHKRMEYGPITRKVRWRINRTRVLDEGEAVVHVRCREVEMAKGELLATEEKVCTGQS
jgi:hypothetical protein